MPRFEVKLPVECYVLVEVEADDEAQAIDKARDNASLLDSERISFTGEAHAKLLKEIEYSKYLCLRCEGSGEIAMGMLKCPECQGTGREPIKT
jgi:DnaJ-class molecular chaperone